MTRATPTFPELSSRGARGRRSLRRTLGAAALAVSILVALPAGAEAGWFWKVKGAGYGHGVGLSQYGAYGFAKKGRAYQGILRHYYRDTKLAKVSAQKVRVLLRPYQSSIRFTGATAACGRTLVDSKTYSATRTGSKVLLRAPNGAVLENCGGVLTASGGASVHMVGKGSYRGSLQARPSSVAGRLNAINAVWIDDYVRGVVALESPASWPAQALRAQAVVARSYALAGKVGGLGFDLYDDTRSQVYGGVSAEDSRTNSAVSATARQVVTYKGKIATTYFFSTSGGRTEHNENVWGGTARPYLRSVKDPWDNHSPLHRWVKKFSRRGMQSRLGDLVRGKLRKIRVVKRGASPRMRVVKLVGSGGVTRTSGYRIMVRLGLYDTWAYFRKVTRN